MELGDVSGGQIGENNSENVEQHVEAINQEIPEKQADDDPIDPGDKNKSVEDEIVVVTAAEATPTSQGTNQKGGGKNKNKKGGSQGSGGSQRGGKRR